MTDVRSIYLKFLQGRVGNVAYELTRVQSSMGRAQETWTPPINAYRCEDRVVICVELAGVDRTQIDVQVEARRVRIRGRRRPPDTADAGGVPLQILALEIDEGPFEREVLLPMDVDPDRVVAEQHNGLLWICLPIRAAGK